MDTRAPQLLPGKLYSYVVTHDTGFAPNPFFGYCTLACCKPTIRRNADLGNWIVGLAPKAMGNTVVYYMRVDAILDSFGDYWRDPRFTIKKPRFDSDVEFKCGDNIYEPRPSREYRQIRSMHSLRRGNEEDTETKAHDLSGERILASETFAYFGGNAVPLPPELQDLVVGRAHKCRFSTGVMDEFLRFVKKRGLGGMRSTPRTWPPDDDSCVKRCDCPTKARFPTSRP
jgi:hypothetical protein